MKNTSYTEGTEQAGQIDRAGKKVCEICGGRGFLRADVPVGHPQFGKPVPCACKIHDLEERRLQSLRKLSNMEIMGRFTFENFNPDGFGLSENDRNNLRNAFSAVSEYAQNPKGWLVLKGDYGCGKTHLAAAIANNCLARGRLAVFVVVPDLLDYLRATYSPGSSVTYDERFDQVRSAPLLILDDLGTQSATPWAQEKLYQLLNYRYVARLPTVITTNKDLEDMDIRIRSRLADFDISRICTITAPGYREGVHTSSVSTLSSLNLHKDQTFEAFSIRESEPPEVRENLTFAMNIAHKYAQDPQGWLVLTGTYGCGKTHLAAAIANERMRQRQPTLFVVVPDLLDHLRATFAPSSTVTYDERFDEVRRVSFLVLDDLGTQSASPWAREKLYQIFNHRYNANLPTVVTLTDMSGLDPRIKSRIMDTERCTRFAIIAQSYRSSDDSPAPKRGRKPKNG